MTVGITLGSMAAAVVGAVTGSSSDGAEERNELTALVIRLKMLNLGGWGAPNTCC
jgi:hypothetical protein